MLSPKSSDRVVLLPQDHEIIQLTGMTEEQYRWFVRQGILHSKLRPGEPVALEPLTIAAIQLVIGIALAYLSTLLVKTPPEQKAPETRDVQGQTIVRSDEFAPKAGFDSVQNVVQLGSTVPLVYANRQEIDGIAYGGIRVNTNLLWSQIYSLGGGQMLRAMFLVGEGTGALDKPGMQLRADQFAIGNNLIDGYLLGASAAGRITIYYSRNTGRLVPFDYLAGVVPESDLGNAMNDGAEDIFQVRSDGNQYKPDFCMVTKPSTQVEFGVYGFIGNNFSFRVNPRFRPAQRFTTRISGERAVVSCKQDRQENCARAKQNYKFAGRGGLITPGDRGLRSVDFGDVLTYRLDSRSCLTDCDEDSAGATVDWDKGVLTQGNAELTIGDAANAVASRQSSWDQLINVGDLYKLGSALAICIGRSDEPFVSEAENEPVGSGVDVEAQFRIVEPGEVHTWTGSDIRKGSMQDPGQNATGFSHLMKVAIGNFVTEKPGRVVEIGIRSNLQVSLGGICNFRDAQNYEQIDQQACLRFQPGDADDAKPINFVSGSYTGPEQRYSFFVVEWRIAGSGDAYQRINRTFGVRSTTGAAVYNYIRFEFPFSRRYEFRLIPLSGWEVRNDRAPGDLSVLDYAVDNVVNYFDENTGAIIQYNGEVISNNENTFSIKALRPPGGNDLGNFLDDGEYYGDQYAKIAEAFIYNEITTTATQAEHSVSYINNVAPNEDVPDYDSLAIVGLNIRASTEINNLDQFSAYVNQGLNATSNFPEVLFDLLTNKRYGTGSIMSAVQIDKPSFDSATDFCYRRRYFFDGAVIERVNIRTWGAERARDFLLDLVVQNGKFGLQPVASFDGPETIQALYSSGNIIADSLEVSYFDPAERVPPRISVRWREERASSVVDSNGLFPSVREVIVREAGTDQLAPLEQIDLSDFCTSEKHAIDRAKWECRFRRLVTHSVRFKTTPSEAAMTIGGVIKLGVETITYNQPQNGAIAADGTVTSWPPLDDGFYEVLLWDGKGESVQQTTLNVAGGKASQRGSVFCLQGAAANVQTYKVQSLSFDEDGNIEVEALFWPTDNQGNSLIVDGFDNDNLWEINGRLYD